MLGLREMRQGTLYLLMSVKTGYTSRFADAGPRSLDYIAVPLHSSYYTADRDDRAAKASSNCCDDDGDGHMNALNPAVDARRLEAGAQRNWSGGRARLLLCGCCVRGGWLRDTFLVEGGEMCRGELG